MSRKEKEEQKALSLSSRRENQEGQGGRKREWETKKSCNIGREGEEKTAGRSTQKCMKAITNKLGHSRDFDKWADWAEPKGCIYNSSKFWNSVLDLHSKSW